MPTVVFRIPFCAIFLSYNLAAILYRRRLAFRFSNTFRVAFGRPVNERLIEQIIATLAGVSIIFGMLPTLLSRLTPLTTKEVFLDFEKVTALGASLFLIALASLAIVFRKPISRLYLDSIRQLSGGRLPEFPATRILIVVAVGFLLEAVALLAFVVLQ